MRFFAGKSNFCRWRFVTCNTCVPIGLAGNLVGLLLAPIILQHFGWRALFYLFGLAGAPLLLLWAAVVPSQKRFLSSSSGGGGSSGSGGGGGIGLGRLLSNSAVWAIIIVNFGA
jgi:predicted MFS family arabinose efflux permease